MNNINKFQMNKFIDALKILKKNDPKLGEVIKLIKPKYNKMKSDDFTFLVKIIIGQQLSGSAARAIVTRVENSLKEKKITPKVISSIDEEDLRKCGISKSKISYIKILSETLLNNPNYFHDLRSNNEINVLEELCEIKGIGIWTASIFAMNSLNYDDIFPYGDASLMKAIKTLYGDKVCIENIISNWSPYKSFGSRVLWLWVDQGMPKI